MVQLIPLPNNPRERKWLLIIIGENNGFENVHLYFPDPINALDHAKEWMKMTVPM